MDSVVASGKCVESGMSVFDPPSTVGWLNPILFIDGGWRLPWPWVGHEEIRYDTIRYDTPVRDRDVTDITPIVSIDSRHSCWFLGRTGILPIR